MILIIIINLSSSLPCISLFFFFMLYLMKETNDLEQEITSSDKEFSDAAYYVVMFIVEHFRNVREFFKNVLQIKL